MTDHLRVRAQDIFSSSAIQCEGNTAHFLQNINNIGQAIKTQTKICLNNESQKQYIICQKTSSLNKNQKVKKKQLQKQKYELFLVLLKNIQNNNYGKQWAKIQQYCRLQVEQQQQEQQVENQQKSRHILDNIHNSIKSAHSHTYVVQNNTRKPQQTKNMRMCTNQQYLLRQNQKLDKLSRYLLKQNIVSNKNNYRIKNFLQQLIIQIQNKFSNICKDFSYYFHECSQIHSAHDAEQKRDNSLQLKVEKNNKDSSKLQLKEIQQKYELETMYKFIREALSKLAQTNNQFQTMKQVNTSLKVSNCILLKEQQKLVNYIEQRKNYSEKLKLKINELRQEMKVIKSAPQQKMEERQSSHKQMQQYLNQIQCLKQEIQLLKQKSRENIKIQEELNTIEQNTDLKYRSRNDLILMIRALSYKIIKYQKQNNKEVSRYMDGTVSIKQNLLANSQSTPDGVVNSSRYKLYGNIDQPTAVKINQHISKHNKRILGQSIDKFLNKNQNIKKRSLNTQNIS